MAQTLVDEHPLVSTHGIYQWQHLETHPELMIPLTFEGCEQDLLNGIERAKWMPNRHTMVYMGDGATEFAAVIMVALPITKYGNREQLIIKKLEALRFAPDVPQAVAWGLCTNFWKAMIKVGQDKDMALIVQNVDTLGLRSILGPWGFEADTVDLATMVHNSQLPRQDDSQ